MKKYKQFYTSSLFNIENNIDYTLQTTFINVLTDEDLEVFNKIMEKQVVYNSELHFFNCFNVVKKVIESHIPIYSDNIKIRRYLFENGANPKFIKKKYVKIDKNIDFNIFDRFEITSDENIPLIMRFDNNIDLIVERLKKKLPTFIVNNINIWEIEEAVNNKRMLYVENVDEFINKITDNLYVSESIEHLKNRFQKCYYKKDYSVNDVCLFFGMYSGKDIQILKKHQGYKFLIWGGTDCNWNYKDRVINFEIINKIPNLYHISISKDIQERLSLKNIESIFFELNLVDKGLFKPVSKKGDYIFIYNGYKKGNEHIYGNDIYDKVVKLLPEFKFIYSNELNAPYNEMPNIYAKCFIGLRLTDHDGNANMVQEMKEMNIPVVHNLSDYGLKWNCVNDIIKYINKYYS